MKNRIPLILFFTILFFPRALLAQGSPIDSCISPKLLLEELDSKKAYSIFITHYVDYASSKAVLHLTKELDGYYATYTKVSDNRFEKTRKRFSKQKLNDLQFLEFKSFEKGLQMGPKETGSSESMTIFTIKIGDKERKYIDHWYHFKATTEIERILKI